MDPFAFALNENQTVKEAMAALKKNEKQIQLQVFVVSNDRKLAGVIHLADLMTGSSGSILESLMIRDIPNLPQETSLVGFFSFLGLATALASVLGIV